LVVAGIAGLPEGSKLSGLIALGTGVPYNIADASAGFGAAFRFRRNAGRADGLIEFKQIDLRLAKELQLATRHRMSAFVEVFNVFNWYNHGGHEGFLPPADE